MRPRCVYFQPKRTFGIELEFNRRTDREFLAECIKAAGQRAQITGYQHDASKTTWTCKTDSSCGYEIASRIMGSNTSPSKTLEDLDVLFEVVDQLHNRKAPVDDSCGTHVHIYVGDLGDHGIQSFLLLWSKLEKTVMDMMPKSRKSNGYCPLAWKYLRPDKEFSYSELTQRAFNQRGAVNLSYLRQRGTVEFRLAEGTNDPNMARNWVCFLLHLIETVKSWGTNGPKNANWLHLEPSLWYIDLLNPYPDITNMERFNPERMKAKGILHKTFDPEEFLILDPNLVSVRNWCLERTAKYAGYERDRALCIKLAKEYLERVN